ncbi:MAG TPA: hypothetical protein VFZ04_21140, partial [Longimicrobiales bacterium]
FRDQKVELPCVVTAVSRQISKKNGAEWGRITIEDFFGTATVLAFGDVWEGYNDILVQDAAVLIRGQVSGRDRDEEDPPIFLDSAIKLGSLRTSGQVAVELRLSKDGTEPEMLSAASELFRRHPGPAPVLVGWLTGQNGDAARMRSRQFTVDLSEDLIAELRGLFGNERIRLVKLS